MDNIKRGGMFYISRGGVSYNGSSGKAAKLSFIELISLTY